MDFKLSETDSGHQALLSFSSNKDISDEDLKLFQKVFVIRKDMDCVISSLKEKTEGNRGLVFNCEKTPP